ncbi:MAG TPA: phosphoribosylformylglycinamidine synthase, partial [Candidatus Omnitrophica bacterium]|nr:phosphoribosylformylglycinamidine synthase [Candidatus Omnitrophota bacterium]
MHTIEVTLKDGLKDSFTEKVRKEILDLGFTVQLVRQILLYTIDKELSKKELLFLGKELFADPLIQKFSIDKPMAQDMDWDWLIHVKNLPGVKDNVGERSKEAIHDILGIEFSSEETVYTSRYYLLKGTLTGEEVDRLAREVFAYESVESWHIMDRGTFIKEGYSPEIPKVVIVHQPEIIEFDLTVSEEALAHLSQERHLALNINEMKKIRDYFSRQDVVLMRRRIGLRERPTDAELEVLAQTWSEHCKHKIFNARVRYREGEKVEQIDSLFKAYIRSSTEKLRRRLKWVVSTLWDNSGVVEFNERYLFAFKCETHNSPSAKYPYGGALTGIVGVYRDPMGTGKGVRLIYGTYGFCTADPNYNGRLRPQIHPRRLLEGVRKGVEDGGNKHGVPTPYGITFFDDGYLGKPAIYVLAAGLIPKIINGESGAEKQANPGDFIIMCGGKVGIDGIHGATESSMEGGEHITLGHVQMGDPYTQKKMHDFLNEARDRGLYTCIQDNGAGGLSSSVGEMGYNFGRPTRQRGRKDAAKGFKLYLDRVPLKYQGLDPWQILLSESQERMTVSVPPENLEEFMNLAKIHEVEATVLGEFDTSGKFYCLYGERPVTFMDMEFVHEGVPQMELEAEWVPPEERGLKEPALPRIKDHGKFLKEMLSRPNICSKEYITRQFDHEVQGTSVIKHLVGENSDVYSDGVVIRPDLESDEAVAIACGINPKFSHIDTYHMTANAFDEAIRRIIALGGDLNRIVLNDNFCWPSPLPKEDNPDAKYKMAQLVRANRALYDYTTTYGTPCISGKDSMSMDATIPDESGKMHRISALPTIMFSSAGIMDDYRRCVTMDVKKPGDLVFILGKTYNECGGSEYYEIFDEIGLNVPVVRARNAIKLYKALSKAISEGLVASCHGCYRGGLAIALAQTSFAGGYGLSINLASVPRENLHDEDRILYSESASRFVATVPPKHEKDFKKIMKGNDFGLVGEVREDKILT